MKAEDADQISQSNCVSLVIFVTMQMASHKEEITISLIFAQEQF